MILIFLKYNHIISLYKSIFKKNRVYEHVQVHIAVIYCHSYIFMFHRSKYQYFAFLIFLEKFEVEQNMGNTILD
jgi:hypothetical protein